VNIPELERILEQNHVPSRYYSFEGAGGGDCYALELLSGQWTLSYYDDRGNREKKGVFATEDQGCLALFEQLKTMVSWPIRLDPPPLSSTFPMVAEFLEGQRGLFERRGLSFKSQVIDNRLGGGDVLREGQALRFEYVNRGLSLRLFLSFIESRDRRGFSAVLTNGAHQRLRLRDFLAARGYTSQVLLFDYPYGVMELRDYLPRFAVMLDQVFSDPLRPILNGEAWESPSAGR
jgi:hypothetical protein